MIEISITSHPKFLIIVRTMVGKFCELINCPTDDQRKIVLAVDEACANVMRHAYHGDLSRSIEVSCKGNEDILEIELRDCGSPVDAERICPRDLDNVRPGGLGVHFMRSIMDEVNYSRKEGGNILRMVKRFHKSPP